MMTQEERMSILRRYIQDPLSDDTELYYSGILGSSDLSNEVYVACSVLAEWKKQRRESEKEAIKKQKLIGFPEKEGIKKQKLIDFPKNKRTTATVPNPAFKNQKIKSHTKETPERLEVVPSSKNIDLRLTFKLGEDNLFSVQKSSSNNVAIISQKPLPKKCSQVKYEDHRAKKRVRIEKLEPISLTENNNIPNNLKARLLNNKAVLVIKKNLTKTDVAKNNQRLSIPESQLRSPNFLTEEELISLSYKEGTPVPHLHARMIEPCGAECDVKLARWKMTSNFVFNIFGLWKEVVARNDFSENTPIEVYSFREDSQLYFAVVRVKTCEC